MAAAVWKGARQRLQTIGRTLLSHVCVTITLAASTYRCLAGKRMSSRVWHFAHRVPRARVAFLLLLAFETGDRVHALACKLLVLFQPCDLWGERGRAADGNTALRAANRKYNAFFVRSKGKSLLFAKISRRTLGEIILESNGKGFWNPMGRQEWFDPRLGRGRPQNVCFLVQRLSGA